MSKEIFYKDYTEKIKHNFDLLEPFLENSLMILDALEDVKHEIINCLMIEQNIASINCTNHFLERLLKLALIQNDLAGMKIDSKNTEVFTNTLEEANKKYDGLVMSQSIDKCFKNGIINKQEKEYLSKIQKEIRNSYSHSEMEKVNKGKVDNIKMFSFDIKQVQDALVNKTKIESKEILVSTKEPKIQSLIQKENAKNLALTFFKSIYNIAKNIDYRLDFNGEYYKKL